MRTQKGRPGHRAKQPAAEKKRRRSPRVHPYHLLRGNSERGGRVQCILETLNFAARMVRAACCNNAREILRACTRLLEKLRTTRENPAQYRQEFQALCRQPDIRRVAVRNGELWVTTRPLHRFNIAETRVFQIRIVPTAEIGGGAGVLIKEIGEGARDKWHFPCFGNIQRTMEQLRAEGKYASMALLALEFVKQHRLGLD